MYKILRSDGAVLYDVSDPDLRLLTEARGTFEIGQPGSLQFAMVPAHPYYDEVEVMETYVTALRENTEIFYGRIIDINVDKTTGVKQIECAGALQFLDDGELAPITGSDGKGLDLTASAFLTRCITAYNTEINNDPLRVLSVGTINHAKASMTKKYNLTGYTQVKNALDSNLISEYGGYFRIRKDGNNHVIDWLDAYSEPNTSPIRLRENIQNQENTISAGDLFTMIRPSGKNNLVLEPIAISNDLVTRYGRIVKSVNFKDEETEAGLRSAVADYIAEMAKGLGKSCTVRIVDMHFLDGSVPSIRLGSTYTNIAGFEGEPMVVSGMELNFTNPVDDSVTLRNAKDLAAGTKGSVSSKGSVIQDMAKDRRGFQNIWQHITEGEDWLRLFADRIEINAQNLVELVGTFERYAEETTETIQFQGQDISVIKGTGVLQNTDQITQVAGMFSSKYYIVPVGSRPGRNPNQAGWYEAQQYLVKESDVNSGIELYASPAAAMNGRAINTTSQLAGLVGQYVTRMVRTADTTPVEGKNYYTKSLGVLDGAEFTITDAGVETNVGKLLRTTYEGTLANQTEIDLIEGSALWVYRDHITGVTGEYEIVTNSDGSKTLVIVSGGGMKIRRNNVEYGIYDEDNLTGGIIVNKINNTVSTSIRGDHIDLATNTQFGTISSTVGSHTTSINALGQQVDAVQGSALWQARDDVTNVVGSFEYVTVPGTGEQYLVVKDGGAFKLRRNNTEFGVYDEYSLTAGVIVDKVNNGTVTLKGSKVWVGDAATDQTLKKWATESDGLFVQNIGALSARIGSIEADYITANDIDANYIGSRLAELSVVNIGYLSTSAAAVIGGGTYATNGLWVEGTRLTIGNGNFVQSVVGSSTIGGGYKFTVTQADGSSVDYPFNVATSITLSGAWGGASYTATAKDLDDNVLGSVSTSISKRWLGSQLVVESGTDSLLSESFDYSTVAYAPSDVTATVSEFSSSHMAGVFVTASSLGGGNGRLYTFKVDATSEYTAGRTAGAAGVTLSEAGWQGGSKVITASNGQSVTVSIPAIDIGEGGWVSHKKRVSVYSNAGDTGELNHIDVDATSEYNAGRTAGAASVTLSESGWVSGVKTITASNGETVSVSIPAIDMSSGGWVNHIKRVSAYSNAGNTGELAYLEVDATTEYDSGVTAGNTAAGVSSSWNGNTFTVTRAANTSTKSLSCIVTITPSSAQTLGYGQSVTVKALGNASEKASVTITAPADRYQTGYNAGYSAGVSDGIASGWTAARTKISRSGNKIMIPPATVNGAAIEGYVVTVVQGSISATRVTSSNYALSASASAYISGTAVATDSTSRGLTV